MSSGERQGQSSNFCSQTGIPPSFFPLPRVLGEGLEPQSESAIGRWRSNVRKPTHSNFFPSPPPLCVSHWDILFRASSVVFALFAGVDGTHYLRVLSDCTQRGPAYIFRPISTSSRVLSPSIEQSLACAILHSQQG